VYPALAVLREYLNRINTDNKNGKGLGDTVLWVSGAGGMEAELLKNVAVPFLEIPAAGVHGVGVRRLPRNIWLLMRGIVASKKILNQYQPDVIFFTGGYVAVPMALASRIVRGFKNHPKILLYVPDIEPGLALKTLGRFADRVGLTVEESQQYFKSRLVCDVVGYPVRAELQNWAIKPNCKKKAVSSFNLSDTLPILLVYGGSRGARSINQALGTILPELLNETQVIHISGQLDWPEVEASVAKLQDELRPEIALRYRAYPYLHEKMGAALAAADLVVTRAGASSLGELTLFGLPAILVPYPYAWQYQAVNANYLEKSGAAVRLEDKELTSKLLEVVRAIIRDKDRMAGMRIAMSKLAKPEAAVKLTDIVYEMACAHGGDK
jgi:UDP-N-acetylglucosamine--N-acetylmuramyl-(pentapeptide) pyrophosphoryl-undecaprenol N-acetylglucosamine transferase